MEISRPGRDPFIPKALLDARIPAETFLRPQRVGLILTKDHVLRARRTESGRDARVQRRVCLVDLVTARETIRPNLAVLIELRVATAADQNEIVDLSGRFREDRPLFRMIADERGLMSESLANERPLLSCVRRRVERA